MRVIDPADQDLAFLGSVCVRITNPDLPEIVMAERLSCETGIGEADFDTTDADLRRCLLRTRRTIAFDVEDVDLTTRVDIEAVFDGNVIYPQNSTRRKRHEHRRSVHQC